MRGAGINASDWKKRQGLMDPELPQILGYVAAGIVDELGVGVTDVAVGDRVFGASPMAQADLAVLSAYAPIPASLDFAAAAALPAAVEGECDHARPQAHCTCPGAICCRGQRQ